ncbi:MAG: leucine-rich repeat domain-containing protein, partial [Firmicutes bacterium]|nr:leucine-rich repeat domain-containing protein [Bacillota bacterium]
EEGITLIDEKAFTECVSLANVEFEESDLLLTFGNAVFSYYGAKISNTNSPLSEEPAALKSFEVPARTTKIGQHMFRNNVWFETLTFEQPKGQIVPLTIDNYAFSGTDTANNVSGGYIAAYPYSKQFTQLTIPARTVSIGQGSFASQFFVETLTFEQGFNPKTIGKYAFSQMLSLKSLNLAEGMETIGESMFAINKPNATATTGATYYDAEHGIRTLVSSKKGEFGFGTDCLTKVVIPYGVKTINENAFQNRSEIDSLEIADTVETIAAAFLSTTVYNENPMEIVLPRNLKSLAGTAFNGWKNITKVVIDCPYLTTLDGAFSNNQSYEVAAKDVVFGNIGSLTTIDRSFVKANLKSVTFTNDSATADLAISGSFCDENGRSISPVATIVLPSNVKSISRSFENLPKLEEIAFATDHEHYSFVKGGLYYTDGSEKVLVTWLLAYPDADIADDTTKIGEYAFKGTNAIFRRPLDSVTIPASVKVIDQYAFACVDIASITIPDTVESLENNALHQSAAKSIVCGARYIKDNAFDSCVMLETLVLTGNVEMLSTTSIVSLGNPSKLVSVTLQGNTVKTLVRGFGTLNAYPLFNNTDEQSSTAAGNFKFKILVDNATVLAQYMQDAIWTEANVADILTATKVDVTFGSSKISIPAGAELSSMQVPYDESGYVWLTPSYKEVGAGSVIDASVVLSKAYKVTVVDGENSTVTYVIDGGKMPAAASGKAYFTADGKVYDASKAVSQSMTLTLAETVTVTLPDKTALTVIKGGTVPAELLGNETLVYEKEGAAYVFDANEAVSKAVTLQKPVVITLFDTTATPATSKFVYAIAGKKVAQAQIDALGLAANQGVANGDKIVTINADTVFNGEATYMIRQIVVVTFLDELANTNEQVTILNGTKVPVYAFPGASDEIVWGKLWSKTYQLVNYNNKYFNGDYQTVSNSDGIFTYYKFIDVTIVVSAEAAKNGAAATVQGDVTIAKTDKNNTLPSALHVFKYGAAVTVPELKAGYAYFDENGNKYTAQQLAKATKTGIFTAKPDVTYTVDFGGASQVSVIKGETVAAEKIPTGCVWGTVADGKFTAFDFSQPVTADVTLVKYVQLTFTDGSVTPVTYTVPANGKLAADQLTALQLDAAKAWALNGKEVTIDANTEFAASASYTALKKVTVTFGGSAVTTLAGYAVDAADYVAPASGHVWVSVKTEGDKTTYTEYSQSATFDADATFVAKIKVTVYASAAAVKENQASGEKVYYLDAGDAITFSELKDNYAYTLNGAIVADVTGLTASTSVTYTAAEVETVTVILADGTVKTVTLIK